jgi:hypothetical protein
LISIFYLQSHTTRHKHVVNKVLLWNEKICSVCNILLSGRQVQLGQFTNIELNVTLLTGKSIHYSCVFKSPDLFPHTRKIPRNEPEYEYNCASCYLNVLSNIVSQSQHLPKNNREKQNPQRKLKTVLTKVKPRLMV